MAPWGRSQDEGAAPPWWGRTERTSAVAGSAHEGRGRSRCIIHTARCRGEDWLFGGEDGAATRTGGCGGRVSVPHSGLVTIARPVPRLSAVVANPLCKARGDGV